DRGKQETLNMLKELTERGSDFFISTITVSEILAGAHHTKNPKKSVLEAKHILGQFNWVEFDGTSARTTGEMIAKLYEKGEPIEYQDVAIAASALSVNSDFLITENTGHFKRFSELEGKVYTPEEFREQEI
ncbi:MAG: type II toxin-antitoxin system VapC family toxin, partial [Candidatus Nanohaloarchaea archaeon]|nr:type II toxin-antitoxin system VapC family toxin [Candidatus Nanohaloarchaea archaeon]